MFKPGVHIVPTNFEYDRVIQPLFNDFTVKKAYLLVHEPKKLSETSEKEVTVSGLFVKKIKDIPIKWEVVSTDLFDFDGIFKVVYGLINKELKENNPVYINISSASKMVQLAITFAAFLNREYGDVELYYVVPERYFDRELLTALFELNKKDVDEKEAIKKIKEIAKDIRDHGITSGEEGLCSFQPFKLAVFNDMEYEMIKTIYENKEISSIKDMKTLLDDITKKPTPRSNIKYYLDNLEKMGLIYTLRDKKELKIRLTKAGELYSYTYDRNKK